MQEDGVETQVRAAQESDEARPRSSQKGSHAQEATGNGVDGSVQERTVQEELDDDVDDYLADDGPRWDDESVCAHELPERCNLRVLHRSGFPLQERTRQGPPGKAKIWKKMM